MKIVQLILLSIFLFAFSCKNEGSSTVMEQEVNDAVEQAIGKTSDEYNGKLDELLTLEIASEVTGYTPNEAKKKYSKILKDPATHSVSYNWDKGRMKKVNNPITNKEMNVPINDFVKIAWVRNTTLEKFKFDYHTPTAEEIKIANEAMDKKLSEMVGEGKATKEQADLSKEMGKSYPNLFQTITSTSVLRSSIFDFMRSKNGNVIAVVDKKKVSVKKYILDNQKDVRLVSLTEIGALIPESLSSKLQKDRINYVVLETESTVLIKATLKLLLSKLKECAIQLVILEPNETLETDEIEFDNLVQLKLLYPSMTRENSSVGAEIFEKNYKLKNKVTPNAFAIRGFDVTFDALMRLSQATTFSESTSTQVTEQVESKFDYLKNETGGFANKGLYILYYDADLTVKVAK